jgi:hypothetical protein
VLSKVLAILSIILVGAGTALFIVVLFRYGWRESGGSLHDVYFVTRFYLHLPLVGYVDSLFLGMSIACAIILAGGVSFALSRRLR